MWATNLRTPASAHRERLDTLGLSQQAFPLHVDARSLWSAYGFFGAIVCVDASIYFRTDDLYPEYLQRFGKPGGQIGSRCPGAHAGA